MSFATSASRDDTSGTDWFPLCGPGPLLPLRQDLLPTPSLFCQGKVRELYKVDNHGSVLQRNCVVGILETAELPADTIVFPQTVGRGSQVILSERRFMASEAN